jgi:formamidopyrimidine-DNA glycosylase
VEQALAGRTFLGGRSHGKQMLFEFSGGAWLGLHLGMSGRLLAEPAGREPEKSEHLVLSTPRRQLVFSDYRMFGKVTVDLVGESAPPPWWRELPPEILSARFTKEAVAAHARRHAKTPLKTLLLDQRAFPGIGNWMADEACWRLCIDPRRLSGDLDLPELAALWRVLRQVSRDALRVIGSDWGDPPDSWLMNHRWRDGGICPRPKCRAPLVREDLRGRTTCRCPGCQG